MEFKNHVGTGHEYYFHQNCLVSSGNIAVSSDAFLRTPLFSIQYFRSSDFCNVPSDRLICKMVCSGVHDRFVFSTGRFIQALTNAKQTSNRIISNRRTFYERFVNRNTSRKFKRLFHMITKIILMNLSFHSIHFN